MVFECNVINGCAVISVLFTNYILFMLFMAFMEIEIKCQQIFVSINCL